MSKHIRFHALALLFVWLASPLSAETLVVLNKAEATASLIDLKTGSLRATVQTGKGPHEVATSPDGRYALVSNYGTREAPGSTLTVIDLVERRAIRTFDIAPYAKPHGVCWLKDGKRALITSEANQALLIVDPMEGKVIGAIQTGQEISHMVVATPDGKRAFVANIGSGNVSVVDLSTAKLISTIATGKGAEGIDITPDGKQLWVTNREADNVSVIDPATLEIISTVPSKSFPIRAKATVDSRFVLVSNARSGDVAVFHTGTQKEVQRIKISLSAADTEGRLFGGQFGSSSVPIGIVVHPGGKRAYVANANADLISVIDLQEWKVIGALKAGKEPDGMAYSPVKID